MTYHIDYKLFQFDKIKTIDVAAKSKKEAYRIAAFELIPEREGEYPYSAWVDSVTYQNGNFRQFNHFEGFPY